MFCTFKQELEQFTDNSNLSAGQETILQELLIRCYVQGSVDGILDLFLPLEDISFCIDDVEKVQKLSNNDYALLRNWVSANKKIEKHRELYYTRIEEHLFNSIEEPSMIDSKKICQDIATNIVEEYL